MKLLPWDAAAIQQLLEREENEAAYLLDPNTPMEVIDAELRAAGLDPEQIGAEGEDLVRKLLGTRIDA